MINFILLLFVLEILFYSFNKVSFILLSYDVSLFLIKRFKYYIMINYYEFYLRFIVYKFLFKLKFNKLMRFTHLQ